MDHHPDPLTLRWGLKDLYVDLGAERLLAAQKGNQKIAVEVKSFSSPSEIADLEQALGQFILYHDVLAEREPDRTPYLAVSQEIWKGLFREPIGRLLFKNQRIQLLVFDSQQEVLLQWIP